ncbi:MAG: amidohydrolase, partial [Candidatus Aminicenantes bacterium]|nr:amidohydrolase [Candidatus Aminicenantes bacterium]
MFSKLYSKSLIMIFTFLFLGSFFSCAKKEPADLVLMNGKIVTVDDKKPVVQALAVRGDVIVALGNDKRIKPYISQATQIIDLKGKLAIPG